MGELSLISGLPESNGRTIRPYMVDDINTVGGLEREPYAIRFRNPSSQRIEIRISVDGTDVLSGRQATRDPRDGVKTWVVRAHGTMELKAWPETVNGGAAFLFTDPEDSVAAHTHGDLGALGYVSVAVFREGYVPPPAPMFSPNLFGGGSVMRGGATKGGGLGTGAGEYVEQRIGTASGLVRPEFDRIVQLRYMPWDQLLQRLYELGYQIPVEHPTGFIESGGLANLGTTPRPKPASVAVAEDYPRLMD